MKRLNITLPLDVAGQLEAVGNKSSFIAEAVRDKLHKEKKKRLENLLTEGYRVNQKESQKIAADWGRATIETWE